MDHKNTTLQGQVADNKEHTLLRLIALCVLLWVFLVCINGMSYAIKGFGGESGKELFAAANNPIIALMMGMLVTCLVQSSSTTTSLIVGLVASGELGVDAAVPMVMGANIGTTITNTLVSMGSITRSEEFRRSFAAANVHDVFNLMAVMILLPLEIMFGVISKLAKSISGVIMNTGGVETGSGSGVIKAHFKFMVKTMDHFFEYLAGPTIGNWLLLLASIGLLIAALYLIVKTMRGVILRRAEVFFDKILGRSAVVCMGFGMVVTAMVQSSSVTTSIMVPLAGAGVASLPTIFAITLGCNLGTTITALLASLGNLNEGALAIALCHVLFNVLGILIIYPIPALRKFVLDIAQWLAERCTRNKSFAIIYIVGVFYLLPLIILGIQKLIGG